VNTYETTFILDPGLEEARVDAEIDRVSGWIKDGGGEVVEIQRWGRRRLAYEIERKRDGIYTLILHTSPSDLVRDVERRIRLNESMMRVLTVVHVPASAVPGSEVSSDDQDDDGSDEGPRRRVASDDRDDDDED